MPALERFTYRGGTAPVSAALTQALAAIGATNPHTGAPFTEAFLVGMSGGATFGYFTFAYKGYDPQVALLSRNSFNSYGWDAITRRIGIAVDVMHSTTPEKARAKLVALLEEGHVPIVWADVCTLGYEVSEYDDMWMMTPMIVSSYENDGRAIVHDRSRVPIDVDAAALDAARAVVKKDKHRIVTIDLPARLDLAPAVREALVECVALFDGRQPVGSGKNFGIPGYRTWIERLTRPGARESWGKLFGSGRNLFAGLVSAYRSGLLHWKDESLTADRHLFAAFLEEAATILGADDLLAAAARCRVAGDRWRELGAALLPDDVAILGEARALLIRRHAAFLSDGVRAHETLAECDRRLVALREQSERELPHDVTETLWERLADAVNEACEADRVAVEVVRKAVD